MTKTKFKEFMEQFDLGWHKECYTIAKVTFEREIMKNKTKEGSA